MTKSFLSTQTFEAPEIDKCVNLTAEFKVFLEIEPEAEAEAEAEAETDAEAEELSAPVEPVNNEDQDADIVL